VIDAVGNAYITDARSRVRKIDAVTGIVTTEPATSGVTGRRANLPHGATVREAAGIRVITRRRGAGRAWIFVHAFPRHFCGMASHTRGLSGHPSLHSEGTNI
jgi:hypothetical protein